MTLERRERETYVRAIAAARDRLAGVAAGSDDLRALHALEAALDQLDAPPISSAYAAVGMSRWLDGLGSGADLLAELVPDPRRRFGPDPAMSAGTADAIVAGWQGGGSALGDFHAFFESLGLGAADRADMAHTGLRRLLDEEHPVAPGQSVGVLLPLRLETRFREPVAAGDPWTLRLRVYPEEAAFDRDPGRPTGAEILHVEAMWEACAGALDTADGKAAFGRLAGRVGGPRAAALARLPVRRTAAGRLRVGARTRPEGARRFHAPRGLPARLEIWIARGGGDPARAATLRLDRRAIAAQADLDALLRDRIGARDPDAPPPDAWWSSLAEALRVGLAADIDLGPDRPDDIDVVLAVGLGDASPAALFRRHVAAGRMAPLAPGTPTNTVAGQPAADLGRDPETWYGLARAPALATAAAQELSLALAGGAPLGPLPGADVDVRTPAAALVGALFPVLLGRALKDVWRTGEAAYDTGRWARRWLVPEGPFPAVRIGDQPYGVLPATALRRFAAHRADPPVEAGTLLPFLDAAVPGAAAAAEADGTVVDAGTERLLDVLARTPVSAAYEWRRIVPYDLLRALAVTWGAEALEEAIERRWRDGTGTAFELGLRPPLRRYIPFGRAQPLPELPLAGEDLRDHVHRLLAATNPGLLLAPDPDWGERGRPFGLLARLIRHALVVTNAEIARFFDPDRPWRAPLLFPIEEPWRLAELARQDHRDDEVTGDQLALDAGTDITRRIDHPAAAAVARTWEAVRDGALALVDGAVPPERLDAAFRALLDTASHRLDPWATGIAARRLRWLADRGARWRLGAYGWVDAPAPAVRDELRPGPTPAGLLHAPSPGQALAAAVLRDHAVREDDVARWDLALDSAKVRAAARLAAQVRAGVHVREALGRLVEELAGDPGLVDWLRRAFPMRPEHAGRRVCDGERAVAAARGGPAAFTDAPAEMPIAAIAALADVVDTYGDLLVADAVADVVAGRGDRAAEAMEAAAGFGPPPDLRSLRTPREGVAVATAVLALVPRGRPWGRGAPPGALADPAFARLLEDETGAADGAAWTWRIGGGVALAALGLRPVDALTVPDGALAARIRAAAGAPTGAAPPADPPGLGRARELRDLLGVPEGLPRGVLGVDAEDVLAAAVAQLRRRLAALAGAAAGLAATLRGGAPAAALAEAERWGIEPRAGGADAAAATLGERLAREAEAATADASLPPAHESVALLVRRVRDLAGTDLPVIVTVPRAALRTGPGGGRGLARAGAGLDEEWLEHVAPVRPPLARLEAWQLGDAAWARWATHPDDPWLAGWVARHRGERAAPAQTVAYGPAGAAGRAEVGVVLLDRLSETIPSPVHVTHAAFGFNGPKARAPQAILLAVPPDVGVPLDVETLVAIVAETRQLARARVATPAALDAFRVAVPTPFLLGFGSGEAYADVELDTAEPRR